MPDFDLFGLGSSDLEPTTSGARTTRPETGRGPRQRDVAHLGDRLERLSLVCMAMWSLLQDKTGVTEQDLLDRVRTLDLMDGVQDGKATRTVSKCTRCNRVMSPRHRRCLYCGAERLVESAFDAI